MGEAIRLEEARRAARRRRKALHQVRHHLDSLDAGRSECTAGQLAAELVAVGHRLVALIAEEREAAGAVQGSPEPDANAIRYTIERGGIGEGERRRAAMQNAMAEAMGRMANALRPHIAAWAGREQGSGDTSLVPVGDVASSGGAPDNDEWPDGPETITSLIPTVGRHEGGTP